MAPRQIVILRHAEKTGDAADSGLSEQGKQRAVMLATLIPKRFPGPDFLFAAAPSKHSNRPVETLTPLATNLGKTLDDDFADQDYDLLARELMQKQNYDGRLVVVCWHHGHIPDLAESLGVQERDIAGIPGMLGSRWDPNVFDRFWSITFENGAAKLVDLPQA